MDKSPEAFRTISEVAETLDTPAHVLRFWESRFPQIRPVKRAGGRRYYRPTDVALLTGIKRLLHEEGLTIRGVQKILREQGVRHVSGLAGISEEDLLAFDPESALEEAMAEQFEGVPVVPPALAEVETAQIIALETALRRDPPPVAVPVAVPEPLIRDLFANIDDTVIDAPAADDLTPPDVWPASETAPEPEPMVMVMVNTLTVAVEPEPPPPVDTPVEPDEPERLPVISRGAMLRALPHPLPNEMLAGLVPLRNQLASLRDRLVEAARQTGR